MKVRKAKQHDVDACVPLIYSAAGGQGNEL
ncbi:hypothetical protein F896_01122 [Acinetobacter genomosp. 15BJ]|uniref:Uncharacterized protein n=1 Tax=Acinetobacter genomosp. 15BJ TaxID=106651 RepID=R9B4V3_9GAMM|nr:hypothetical protein F896_01122 [Acinetobacter genomosp. 15BJ]